MRPAPGVFFVLVGILVPATSGAQRWWETGPAIATPTPLPSPTATPAATCRVDVFDAEPAVPFDFLGLVEVQGRSPVSDRESLLEAAKLRACSLGGDALVLLSQESSAGAGTPRRGGSVLPSPGLRAAVIRYRR